MTTTRHARAKQVRKPAASRAPTSTPSTARAKASPTDRKRRSPDQARRTIVDAALTLIADRGPDAIGLKDVARAAGVSHALVSHYFGTYDALVDAAFQQHLTEQRIEGLTRIVKVPPHPSAWLDVAFEHLSNPMTGRLLIWAMLTGRLERDDFVVLRERGMAQTVDLLEAYLRATGVAVDRDVLENGTMIGFCAALGYSLGRKALWGSLGKRATAERDAGFRAQLSAMLLSGLSSKPESAR
jgi:AcrR family transcriptional regulator